VYLILARESFRNNDASPSGEKIRRQRPTGRPPQLVHDLRLFFAPWAIGKATFERPERADFRVGAASFFMKTTLNLSCRTARIGICTSRN